MFPKGPGYSMQDTHRQKDDLHPARSEYGSQSWLYTDFEISIQVAALRLHRLLQHVKPRVKIHHSASEFLAETLR